MDSSQQQEVPHDGGTRLPERPAPSLPQGQGPGQGQGHGQVLRQRAWLAAAAGAAAVGSAVVLGELLAVIFSPSLSPMTAVGGAVIDAVPSGVKDWAVALFGTADKVALLVGMALVITGLAALAGVVEDRRRFAGIAVVGAFGVAGFAAVLTRAQANANALVLAVFTAVVAAVLLRFLFRRLQEWGSQAVQPATAAATPPPAPPAAETSTATATKTPPATPTPPPARRRFLQAVAGGAAFTAVGGAFAAAWRGAAAVASETRDVAYWTPRGWSERGPIKTSSRIDMPRSGRPVKAGTVLVGGVAWAQHTGIGKVELRVNRGPWQQAGLAEGISLDTWYQWKLGLDLTEGQYEVQVRATDLSGHVQDEQNRPAAPNGATGFHTIRVDVKP